MDIGPGPANSLQQQENEQLQLAIAASLAMQEPPPLAPPEMITMDVEQSESDSAAATSTTVLYATEDDDATNMLEIVEATGARVEAREEAREGEKVTAETSLAGEEEALLEALTPWAVTQDADAIATIVSYLRLDLLPLATLASYVHGPGNLIFSAALGASPASAKLRSALTDAVLPGIRALRCCGLEDEPPSELSCIITLDIMEDPVIAADGKSYERTAIEKYWEKNGNRPLSPITREEMASKTLIENVNLRSLCAEYTRQHARAKAAAASPEEVTMAALSAAYHSSSQASSSGRRARYYFRKRARGKESLSYDDNETAQENDGQDCGGGRKTSRVSHEANATTNGHLSTRCIVT